MLFPTTDSATCKMIWERIPLFQLIAHGRETGEFDETERNLLKRPSGCYPVCSLKGHKGWISGDAIRR